MEGMEGMEQDLAGVCPRLKQVIQGARESLDNEESFLGRAVCSPLTWGDSKAARAVLKEHFKGKWPDLVICTDCIYRQGIPEILIATIKEVVGPDTVMLCAAANHRPDVIEDFHHRIDSLKSEAGGEERRRAGLTHRPCRSFTVSNLRDEELDEYVRSTSIEAFW
ncbi:hypothetical protein GUITHDRAFT_164467 [Guillardia theta CCMP2712]|uniref:Uncharacterized protein n=1 Tax=Guillardia theta (strain CCMP2712) TaxID=905079 RepID=L1IXW6_GUITC|nr:hypothetical protein GUITHDRAFT_164467 [Guillardia theta CCMP2712]EKX41081.1 hypothetical protein GUITHDRAFT_164467 [Guillardia theta CCMP2712]|eukprot:XP_005828061.1 hypothetical protein GUITHDRAFT_164467 [Guillardia theta CCMP2712]